MIKKTLNNQRFRIIGIGGYGQLKAVNKHKLSFGITKDSGS
jgi:hypothetical protein